LIIEFSRRAVSSFPGKNPCWLFSAIPSVGAVNSHVTSVVNLVFMLLPAYIVLRSNLIKSHMKTVSLLSGLCLSMFFISCGNSSSNITKLADDMCGCFTSAQSKMDAETTELFNKVNSSETPQKTLQEEMAKLKPEKLKEVTELFQSVASKDSPISKCLSDFDKTHEGTKSTNRKQLALDIAVQMKKNNNCALGTAVIYMGAKSIQ
jgi:septal ring factor EnvC (AmiA/AmiB activator)